MPKRSNLFQDIVAIIHAHMAGDATVEESAELTNRVTGKKREVDVVITTIAAGHAVIVSVEASATRRKASSEWVERMIGKHAELPTDKLVLVSENGFTEPARKLAETKGIVVIAPEDMSQPDPAQSIVNRLQSILPKTVTLTPEEARIFVHRPQEGLKWFRAMPDHLLFDEGGEVLATASETFAALHGGNYESIYEQLGLAEISEDLTAPFTLQAGPPVVLPLDGVERKIYVRYEDVDPPVLHVVDRLVFRGTVRVHVEEMTLTYRKLGDVEYAYGVTYVGGRKELFVFTEDDSGGKWTSRILDKEESRPREGPTPE